MPLNSTVGRLKALGFLHNMKIIKWSLAWLVISLTACAVQSTTRVTPTNMIEATEVIPVTSTSQPMKVTEAFTVPVAATFTPTPDVHELCDQKAKTQLDLNKCAAEKWDVAMGELEQLLAALQLSPLDRQTLQQFQTEWKTHTERECNFLYGKVITGTAGSLYYERGSMAPMLVGDCIASRTWLRIHEIESAYGQGQPY